MMLTCDSCGEEFDEGFDDGDKCPACGGRLEEDDEYA